MGDFYVNISVRDASQDKLAEFFRAVNDPAIVGPEENGWTAVASENLDSQSQEVIDLYMKAFSGQLETFAVSVLNHDEDILSVDIWKDGEMVGEYNSCPGYYKSAPTKEDLSPRVSGMEIFANLSDKFDEERFRGQLLKGADEYVDTYEAHETLISMLGLPGYSMAFGFRNGAGDDEPGEAGKFLRVNC